MNNPKTPLAPSTGSRRKTVVAGACLEARSALFPAQPCPTCVRDAWIYELSSILGVVYRCPECKGTGAGNSDSATKKT
jgi:hypothetical protein